MSPRTLHTWTAIAETITWSLLIIAMVVKYSGITPALTPIAGGIHGFGFLSFLIITILLWMNNRWKPAVGLAGLLVSVIPFAALPFARYLDKEGKVSEAWRFSEPGEQPSDALDAALAMVVRKPWQTIAVCLVLVTIVFCTLLWLGPPVSFDKH